MQDVLLIKHREYSETGRRDYRWTKPFVNRLFVPTTEFGQAPTDINSNARHEWTFFPACANNEYLRARLKIELADVERGWSDVYYTNMLDNRAQTRWGM